MPVGTARAGEEGALVFSASNVRGMKRAHELDADQDGDTPRKHGKRLTTKEEVSLFEICNRHADSFGKRSDICNWWKTVATEFTHAHGRPYSWHSVRRKVEAVTKQRVKFLADQRQRQRELSGANPVQDLMHPQWCAVLDIWIPTWQRWEEAEARRIAKRDEMNRRRSQSKPGDQWRSQPQPDSALGHLGLASPATPDETGMEASHSFHEDDPTSGNDFVPITHSPPPSRAAAAATAIVAPPFESSSISIPTGGVRLPPGFETMFSNSHAQASRQPQPSAPVSGGAADLSTNNRMFSAVLETLGKLNKHLDAASGSGATDPRASPVISALVQAASESSAQSQAFSQESQQSTSGHLPFIDIERIKEELRQEMKEELRRERAALEEKLDAVQRTQDMILEMLRQEPA
ncbi:uncharacterized protein N7482_004607 [Penicillium canariense]|uniref:Uncharacterized protein n=1 Tax=Penicillium canariense TaxID=189055 RepID=A0A9W9LQP0_9EURO|nr:uncharacterized protein N7482_004607 [Penicillium canariense]KAJ5169013.1 hypothetical protein N7482_004607 [Penicillium canariense]